MITQELCESAEITLDASGNGAAFLGPQDADETWFPAKVSVRANSATSEAQCRTYADGRYVDGTRSGSSGDSSDEIDGRIISHGEYVWAVWTGGDAGAQAFLEISGTADRGKAGM